MWRKNQNRDFFYRKAHKEGFRSRAAYKLFEIQDKFRLIKEDSTVLDLGSAPGGWLQVSRKITKSFVCGFDLNTIEPIEGVHFGQLDCFDSVKISNFLTSIHAPNKFKVILSDMSPQISGERFGDHVNSMELLHLFWDFCLERLIVNGCAVAKVFEGRDLQAAINSFSKYADIKRFKPSASRAESSELYIIIRNFNPISNDII